MTNRWGAHVGWSSGPRDDLRPKQDGAGWHGICPATQNGVEFKIYELFISGIFHLIFSDGG